MFKPGDRVRYIRQTHETDPERKYFTPGQVYVVSDVFYDIGATPWLNFDKDNTGYSNGHSARFFEKVKCKISWGR